jgi:hypothetical protein
VWRSDGCRREDIPLRIEPEAGQVSENDSQPPSKDPWHVLQEDGSRLYHANDVSDSGPEPPLVVESAVLPGG